jgi:hypothetical protein
MMRAAFDASRAKRCADSASFTRALFMTFTAHWRFILTCSARYTFPMPPSPRRFSMW